MCDARSHISFVSFVSNWHKAISLCVYGQPKVSCLQRHLGPKGPFVISCPQRHLGLHLHNLVVLRSDTIWVLTPTHSIGFNDNTVHCINAYNKCYATIEVQGFFRCDLVKLLNYSTTKCSAIFIVSLSTHVSTLHLIQCLNQFTER